MVVACGVNDSITTERTQEKIKQAIDDYYKKLKELYNEDYVIVKVFFPENHFNAYEIIYRFRTTLDN